MPKAASSRSRYRLPAAAASCNLWTGRERDRHRAICQFCDTDFVGTDGPGGGRFATAADLAAAVAKAWTGEKPPGITPGRAPDSPAAGVAAAARRVRPYVVCTGGEPTLQRLSIQSHKYLGIA